MIRGIYTAAAGLATATLRLGVVSNNVANATTPGYKQDRLPEELGRALDLRRWAVDVQGRPVGTITLGPQVGVSELDLGAGPMQETASPLDLAIAGDGFFAVQGADGQTRYTRDGGFRRDADGALRTRTGAAVLSDAGQPIRLPEGEVAVAADGTLLVDGAVTARVSIVQFAPGQQLTKVGNGQFEAAAGAAPRPATAVQVYQGYLEGSNVDMTESMVATMGLVRAYEANQRLLQIQDETLKSAVNEVGRA
ncbi:MAG: flagellar hook-basal body protein [Chloroflexota bacterium]|nr:flagellar hook-basal body protein [Chloroflexota bacterium]